ncbi:MAG: hypothetical protein K8H84_03335 [Sulfuricella denitrificans]|nr:hypothetical protein [Sulfuricella denitrificans]
MKLNIKPKQNTFTSTHPDTGIEFELRPLSPRKYAELQKKSIKPGSKEIDAVTMGGNIAAFAIAGWGDKIVDDNDEAIECTPETARIFGEAYAYNITPWITDQAMSLDRGLVDEVTAAKNA